MYDNYQRIGVIMSDKINEIHAGVIKRFPKDKVNEYPKEGELCDRILNLIYEYEGEMSTVSAVGVLDLVKKKLLDW